MSKLTEIEFELIKAKNFALDIHYSLGIFFRKQNINRIPNNLANIMSI